MAARTLWASGAVFVVCLVLAAISAAAPKTLFVSPTGDDDGNDCTSQADPCRSFDAAYRAASPGDTVQAAGGTYDGQTIEHLDGRTAGPNVLFRPAPGATVTIAGQLSINGSFVTVRGFRGGDFEVRPPDVGDPPPVSHVTLQDIDGRNFNIFSATDVSVLGGDWGPASDCGGPSGGSNNSIRKLTPVNPARIVIDGATIHDVQSFDLDQCHIEGLAIFAGAGVTVRNSKFFGNSVYDIFVQANSGPISGLTLENNWFSSPVGTDGRSNGSAVGFSSIDSDVTVRSNSFAGVLSLDDDGNDPVFTSFAVKGNIGDIPTGACGLRGVEWDYNVWQAAKCAPTDVSLGGGEFPYADVAGNDLHLTGGRALDLIPPGADWPAQDIDGEARPQGPGIEAGSDEVTSEEPTPTPTATSTPTSTPTSSPTSTPTATATGAPTSTPAPTPTVAPPPRPSGVVQTLRFPAIADAALAKSSPRKRGGSAKLLPVSRSGQALLKFRVEGVGAGRVVRARLRLWVAKGKANRLTVRSTAASWKENRASWRTSPKARGKAVSTLRNLRAGRFVTADLTGAVTRDGLVSLRLSSASRRGVKLASRNRARRTPTLELSVSEQ